MAAEASLVLMGTVTDTRSYWNEAHNMIFTDWSITPSFVSEGTAGGGPVLVRTSGGEVGDVGIYASEQPSFKLNERVQLYLTPNEDHTFSVVDGPKGKVSLGPQAISSNALGFGDPVPSGQKGYDYGTGTNPARQLDAWPIGFSINQAGTADTTNEFAAVVAGFQTWTDDQGSKVNWRYDGTTNLCYNPFDGFNVVCWTTDLPSETLARTECRYNTGSRFIYECDMRFNDNLLWSDSGAPNAYDVQNVATHEAGHFLNLYDLYGAADFQETMYGYGALGETSKRTLEWGDIAGVRYIYPNTPQIPGWFGDETSGSDVALRDINKNGVLDVVQVWVDNPSGPNSIYYRIGWDIDNNGAVSSWTAQKLVAPGGWVGDLTAEAGIALTDINSNGVLDVIIFWIDAPSGGDAMYYRVGWDVSTAGDVASWTTQKSVSGGNIGDSTAGGGATVTNLDSNSRPELVVSWVDNPSGDNFIYYRIGWNLNTNGDASSWTGNIAMPGGIGWETQGEGLAPAVWFTDEFSETITRQWTTQQGTWALESGELSGSGTSAEIKSTKTFPSDRTFQVRMKTVTAGSSSWYTAWAIGKYVDDCSRSTLILHTTGTLEFNVAVGCTKSTWTASTSLSVYDWHTFKMVYTGNNAKVYVDNVLYFDVTDTKFGQLGDSKVQLASWGPSHSHFDDVMVDDSTGKPDLLFTWIDNPVGANFMYYRIGWDLDSNGNAASWSVTERQPGESVLNESQGGGVAAGDVNGNGMLEMIFMWVDNPSGANHGYYRVEWESRVNSHW